VPQEQSEVPPQPPNSDEESSDKKHFLDSSFAKWVIYRVFTGLIWSAILLWILGISLPFNVRLWYLAVPYLLVLIILLFGGKWIRLLRYVFYFLGFIFLVAFLGTSVALVILRIPSIIFRFLRSGRAILITLVIAIVCWTLASNSDDLAETAKFSLIAHVASYVLFLQTFRWASNPYKPILIFSDFIFAKGMWAIEKVYVPAGLKDPKTNRKTAIDICEKALKFLDKYSGTGGSINKYLSRISHTTMLPSFMLGFLLTYFLLALSFSISLNAIENGWGKVIEGLGSDPKLTTYLYFSLVSQATAVPDGVRPETGFGEFWITWLVLTGVLMFSFLITFFTTSLSMVGDSATNQIIEKSKETRDRIKDYHSQLLQPAIEIEATEVKPEVSTPQDSE
jgi:hypothetical protein